MNHPQLLQHIVQNPKLHARFLNTLSCMELCGAQKIARMSHGAAKTTFLLEHAAEEFRHAFFLRKLANKLADEPIESYHFANTLGHNSSFLYIKHLEQRICLLLRQHGLAQAGLLPNRAYLLTTLIVELRALDFYVNYQQILDEYNTNISIKSLISEEEDHLFYITHQVERNTELQLVIDPCKAIEARLFNNWMTKLAYTVLEND